MGIKERRGMRGIRGRRGQIAWFVIFGILIVVIVGGVAYFWEDLRVLYLEKVEAERIAAPEEVMEVENYMYSCIDSISDEGIRLLGLQGGHIEIPEDIVPRSVVNEFSNSLQVFSDTDFEVAYWYYISANGLQMSLMPSKEDMEEELAGYLRNKVAGCVVGEKGSELLLEYNVSSIGNIEADVEIMDDEVVISISYPLQADIGDVVYKLNDFILVKEYPLGRLYDGARALSEANNEQDYLEELTYDMLVADEDIPLNEVNIDCRSRMWSVSDVEKKLKESIYANIFAVRVKGSDNEESVAYGYDDESIKRYYTFDIGKDVDGDVSFIYSKDWNFDIAVFPSEGGVMKEAQFTTSGVDKISALLRGFFCLDSYHFVYDIRYPVLIQFYDSKSGYLFQFALQVVLDNNQAKENLLGGEGDFDIEKVVCSSKIEPVMVTAYGIEDDGSLRSLEDVEISYKCVTSNCDIGKTGIEGNLVAEFPECINGLVIGRKDGYFEGKKFFTTLVGSVGEGESASFSIPSVSIALEKLYSIDYEVIIYDAYGGNYRGVGNGESISLSITGIDERNNGYSQVISENKGKLNIPPGKFEVKGYLQKTGGKYSIEKRDIESCYRIVEKGLLGIFGIGEEKCIKIEIPETKLENIISGGVDLEFELDRMEIANVEMNGGKIIFYLTDYGDVESIEEFNEVFTSLEAGIGMREPELVGS